MSQQNNSDWSSWSSSLRGPRIVCVALAMSCVIYAVLMISGSIPEGVAGPLTYVLPGIGLSMLPLALVISRFVPFPDISSPTEEVDGVFGQEAVLANPADARKTYVGAAMTAFILRGAISESAAIFGLIGFLVGGTPLPICVGLCGVAALAILVMFPRTSDWKMRAESKLGARFPDK